MTATIATATSAPAVKLSKDDRAELKSLLGTFGVSLEKHANGSIVARDAAIGDRYRYDNMAIAEVRCLAWLRERRDNQNAENMRDTAAGNGALADALTGAVVDAATRAGGADVPQLATLEEQMAEILNGAAGETKLAALITFDHDGHTPADYPALKALAKKNPPFGDKSLIPAFTPEQKAARDAFNVCFAWERKARTLAREHGILPAASATGSASASSKPASVKKAPATVPTAQNLSILTDRALARIPQEMTVGDARALLADDYASAITAPYASWDVDPLLAVWRARALPVVKAATIPDTLTQEARDLAADLERTVWLVKVGARIEVCALKAEKMRAKYAPIANTAIVASVTENGIVTRLEKPEVLSVVTIAPTIVAALTPPTDPAASANVTNASSADLARDAAREELAPTV